MKQYTLNFCENIKEVVAENGWPPSSEAQSLCLDKVDEISAKILSGNYSHYEVSRLTWVLQRVSETHSTHQLLTITIMK